MSEEVAQTSKPGSIVTFYSYKGGTGRSMALANAAWVLASSGKRVLAIDWDLEAPGLHRYFEPFLDDKTLERSTGMIDFVREFATAAISGSETDDKDWYKEYANLLAHVVPVNWDFEGEGSLDFVPAGRQDAAYAVRVNSFDWQEFYERLGGGVLFEAVKENLRPLYDFILIDSRTGVSDTSGVCTVQMPDQLVVCFTLNRQSTYGASAAARSAFRQRHSLAGNPTLKVWPVPTRVESNEKDRLELARTMARARFSGLMHQLGPFEEEAYWGEIGFAYEPYYAYEEILASFRDHPGQTGSMLASTEKLATYLNGEPLPRFDDLNRSHGLAAFTSRSAADFLDELVLLGAEYDGIRARAAASNQRTGLMTSLVARAQILGGQSEAGRVAERIFAQKTDGCRVVGLALAQKDPQRRHVEIAIEGIARSRSQFEQFQALVLADRLLTLLEPSAAEQVRATVNVELGRSITHDDPSRFRLAERILQSIEKSGAGSDAKWTPPVETVLVYVAGHAYSLAECRPRSPSLRYTDVNEKHGPFVVTRGNHQLSLPPVIRVGQYAVTNALFREFVLAGGYENDAYWTGRSAARRRLLTADGQTLGPGSWPSPTQFPEGLDDHPVSSISYVEARAFASWCNAVASASDWRWTIPAEDHWEYAARSDTGLIYPWGDAFDPSRCNSSESGIGTTTRVGSFEAGRSSAGCYDMAGNVWEFVKASDAGSNWCVMRGGSYLNDRYELRSYLRLRDVPHRDRAPDFGFRLAQEINR